MFYRARHGVNLLELKDEVFSFVQITDNSNPYVSLFVFAIVHCQLCEAAQEYADKLAASGNFEHSGDQRSWPC